MNEIFGPTIQGEGPNMGKSCIFLRLAHCNLRCKWCDTQYAWNWMKYDVREESVKKDVKTVAAELIELADKTGIYLLVISGGEPMLQQEGIKELVTRLRAHGSWWIEIETAGTVVPNPYLSVDAYNVSPKLTNSGNSVRARLKPEALAAFVASGKAAFKFVIVGQPDLKEVDELVDRFGLWPVYVMPEGTTPAQIRARSRWLIECIHSRGYFYSPRLHTMIWGKKRGV